MKYLLRTGAAAVTTVLLGALLLTTGCAGNPTDDDPTPPSRPAQTGEDAEVDRWMFDYLTTHYLWNAAVRQTSPDYALGYTDFLNDILEQVAAQNDINHDDGHWEEGRRRYFYSNIARYKNGTQTATRSGTREQTAGYGFEQLMYAFLDEAGTQVAFIVAAVHPDGPAGRAGLQRGDVISRIDGNRIYFNSLDEAAARLFNEEEGSLEVTLLDLYSWQENRSVSLTAATYDDNPILLHKIVTLANGTKVGYLFYNSFNRYYDAELIDCFAGFRAEGIDELVLDLRYNGGGHLVSSTVLGTLVAGEARRNGVFARISYNDDRRNEATGLYRIGNPQLTENNPLDIYQPIGDALAAAVGLDRVYVLATGSTASASEQVINGLRGLDIDVRLIGSTTNGKNVGMEPVTKIFGAYEYEFSPITFYIRNGRDESDYSNGFAPDAPAEEYFWYETANAVHAIGLGDEANDELILTALAWIEAEHPSGAAVQPRATRSRAQTFRPVEVPRRGRPRAVLLE